MPPSALPPRPQIVIQGGVGEGWGGAVCPGACTFGGSSASAAGASKGLPSPAAAATRAPCPTSPAATYSIFPQYKACSIEESHPAGSQRDQAMATFWREVAVVERALAPLLPALAGGPPAGGVPRVRWL